MMRFRDLIFIGYAQITKSIRGELGLRCIITIIVFCLIDNFSLAQNAADNWYFGNNAGLNFNGSSPVVLTNGAMSTDEGCATISDTNGNLLFYTNGITIWDKTHTQMTNGFGLKGHNSSTQSAVIVPKPGSNNLFYIFTVDAVENGLSNGLRYSIVDMSLRSGLGDVTVTKNILLVTPVTEKITAVSHRNGQSIWIITHKWNSNSFYTYLLTSNGVSSTPTISNIGTVHTGSTIVSVGYMKSSPKGDKLALAITNIIGRVEVFDFNNYLGVVSNPLILTNFNSPYGIEFSPDSKKLYISNLTSIYSNDRKVCQLNLEAGSQANIINSTIVIKRPSNDIYALQLGPDDRIYCAKNDLYMDVINSPNSLGSSCNYIENQLYLNGKRCKKGFPNFIQSFFDIPGFSISNICFGSTSNFVISNTSGIDSVLWNFDDPSTEQQNSSTLFNPGHTFSGLGNYDVTLIMFHDYVSDTFKKEVYIESMPVADFTTNDSVQCLNSNNFVFNDSSIVDSGTLFYYWDFGDGSNSSNVNTNHDYSTVDTFNVSLTVTSIFGCQGTINRNVYVLPNPKANFSVLDSIQCLKVNNFVFTNNSVVSGGNLNFLWNFGNGDTSSNTETNKFYKNPGTFTVSLTAKTDFGCVDSTLKNITVHPSPKVELSILDSMQCLNGNEFSFTNYSTINQGTLRINWSFGDGNTCNSQNALHRYSASDTFSIELVAISELGCTDSLIHAVYVFPSPNSDFVIDDDVQCLNENNFIFTNNSSISSGVLTNSWDFGDNSFSISDHPHHIYANNDTLKVKLLVISDKGCIDSSFKNVYIHPSPEAVYFINNNVQCLNGNKFIFNNSSSIDSGFVTYSWDFGDGSTSASENPHHYYENPGTFNVILSVISDLGCSDFKKKVVYAHPSPIVDFSVNDSIQCLKDNKFIFANNSSITSGTVTYFWDFEDDNISLDESPVHNYLISKMYEVKLIAESDYGCKDTMKKKMMVNPMPNAAFVYNNNCLRDTIYFYDKSSIDTQDFINSWSWNMGDSNLYNQQNPDHIFGDTGIYAVNLVASTDFGCSDETTKYLNINEQHSQVSLIMATVEKDEYILVEWSLLSVRTPMSYLLERSVDGIHFEFIDNFDGNTLEYLDKNVDVDKQSYTYRLMVIDSCEYESTYSNIGKSILLKVDHEKGYPHLSWSAYEKWSERVENYEIQFKDERTNTFSSISFVDDETFTYNDLETKAFLTQYTYRIVAHNKIEDIQTISNEVSIDTEFNIWIPNTFTPNGDGLNDLFKLTGTFISDFQISIFSKWGEKVFSSEDVEHSWDGTYRDTVCQIGNYYYVIFVKAANGRSKKIDGNFVLLR